jgi:hypothetical protein
MQWVKWHGMWLGDNLGLRVGFSRDGIEEARRKIFYKADGLRQGCWVGWDLSLG